MLKLKNKGKKRSQNRKKRVKVVRQSHKIKFYIDKKYKKKLVIFLTFFYHYSSVAAFLAPTPPPYNMLIYTDSMDIIKF